jgi:hypothetical protein
MQIPERKSNRKVSTHASNVEVKNGWKFTCTPPILLHNAVIKLTYKTEQDSVPVMLWGCIWDVPSSIFSRITNYSDLVKKRKILLLPGIEPLFSTS